MHDLSHRTADTIIVTASDLERLQPILDQSAGPLADVLESELQRATIVRPDAVPDDVVTMNSDVVYEDCATGARRAVRLVYPKDADASTGRVSVLAPIGSALLGLRVGQAIDVRGPGGVRQIRVVELRYQPEAAGDFAR